MTAGDGDAVLGHIAGASDAQQFAVVVYEGRASVPHRVIGPMSAVDALRLRGQVQGAQVARWDPWPPE